ncbi:hypothetical protein LO762_19120 [Actinocorallia sp. API 0066]|uniref:hypothetical protein n=1 Tax=Actinocorallia sp. API 0066 TaxID=2896846 RepID=UPI001E40F250|nr:hypothetical protein [Actinocorallia sp. API 0066]MCD0451293.1 hypothetical protein [Actinocorallia sp. API 0066]
MVAVVRLRAVLPGVVAGACAVAGAVAVAAPAQAAPRACVLGTWKQTAHVGTVIADDSRTELRGAHGVRLKVTRTGVAYDFTKSTKETTTGVVEGIHWNAWTKYTGKLSFDATVKGAKSGTIRVKPRTAAGGARGTHKVTRPNVGTQRNWKLRTTYRAGGQESVAPARSSFSCSGGKLVLKSGFAFDGRKITIERVFTRIR